MGRTPLLPILLKIIKALKLNWGKKGLEQINWKVNGRHFSKNKIKTGAPTRIYKRMTVLKIMSLHIC